jgi:hypothetical protein
VGFFYGDGSMNWQYRELRLASPPDRGLLGANVNERVDGADLSGGSGAVAIPLQKRKGR